MDLKERIEKLEKELNLIKNEIEIKPFKPGWVVDISNRLDCLLYAKNIGNDKVDYYGFKKREYWDSITRPLKDHNTQTRPATNKEIENALVSEAIRRGYEKGTVIKDWSHHRRDLKLKGGEFRYNSKIKNISLAESESANSLYLGNCQVFHNGVWAEIVKKKNDSFSLNNVKYIVEGDILYILNSFGMKTYSTPIKNLINARRTLECTRVDSIFNLEGLINKIESK